MKKVICFLRVSSNSQDLEAQRVAVMKAIKHDEFKASEIETVEGKESAIKLEESERKTLNQLKEYVTLQPSIKDVYFFAPDRLARKVSIVLSIVEEMTKLGVCLHFLHPYPMQTLREGKEDLYGKAFLTFMAIGAEMEMQVKFARFKEKHIEMKEQGKLIGGNVLFGYFRNKKTGYPEIKEDEAKYVERIFNEYLSGKSMRNIAKDLIIDGVFENSLNTALVKVSHIINNKAYSGRTPMKGNSKENKTIIYPAIVDAETQDKAISISSTNKRPKETSNIYFGKGLVKLYSGGEKEYALTPIKGNASYGMQLEGMQVNVNINVIDTIIWHETQALYEIYKKYEEFQRPQQIKTNINEIQEKIDNLAPIFARIQEEENRINKMYQKGRIDESSYDEMYEQLMKEKKVYVNEQLKFEGQIKRLNSEIQRVKNDEAITMDFSTMTDEEKYELAHEMISKVVVQKIDKYDYEIHVEPSILFRIGIVQATYYYNCKGGKKYLEKQLMGRKFDMTNQIEIRYKQKQKKVAQ